MPRPEQRDLEAAADRALRRTAGRGALGNAKAGDVALIVVPPDQDSDVLNAIHAAMRDRGIEEVVDVVTEHEVVGVDLSEFQVMTAAEGWREVLWREENAQILGYDFSLSQNTLEERARRTIRDWINKHKHRYTAIYIGSGGRPQYRYFLGEHGGRFRDNWMYVSRDDLLSDVDAFPDEIVQIVENQIVETMSEIAEVRIHDPEGSHLTFTISEEEARYWASGALMTGHLFMYPAGNRFVMGTDHRGRQVRHLFPNGNGVLAGCANHFGFFPRLRLHLKDGLVDRVEGGGKFGELLTEMEAKTRHVHYPGFPKPGYLYLMEVALGTNPKMGRRKPNLFSTYLRFPNIWERNQAGIIHWGFGAESPNPDFLKYAEENGLPSMHGFHIHTYFTTYEARLRGSKRWVKLLDRGRITALDSEEVRRVAAKYGDPDQLLQDSWRPRLPGINYPGDYSRDYAGNPVPWVWQELQGLLPETIGVR